MLLGTVGHSADGRERGLLAVPVVKPLSGDLSLPFEVLFIFTEGATTAGKCSPALVP